MGDMSTGQWIVQWLVSSLIAWFIGFPIGITVFLLIKKYLHEKEYIHTSFDYDDFKEMVTFPLFILLTMLLALFWPVTYSLAIAGALIVGIVVGLRWLVIQFIDLVISKVREKED